MANQLNQNGILIDGAWTGASDLGMINLNPTGSIASGASALRIDTDTGTPAASGFGIEIDDDSVDGGTFYSLLINSANNEGLHVEAGLSLFAELTTFTAGIDSDAGLDVDLATNANLVNVTHAANDITAGDGIITVYDDSTGQTNASYLLRLAREADADAQDHFILCEDNSTGAAGNGDDMFAVDSGGAVTAAGNITANGNIVGDGATTVTGVISTTEDVTGANAIAITECGTTYTNTGAGGQVVETLPEASTAVGCELCFVVTAAQQHNINPNDGVDQILGLTDAAGDSVQSNAAGDYICVMAVGDDSWAVTQTNNSANNADGWADAN
jgi:hypothetical protein